MSDVKWTDNQRDAISARKGSILVSAAAGSGKTAVLVQRIIEAVTDSENPISIDKMLIVTFTRAASAEMRTRIEEALNPLLKEDPYNKHLLTQKQLLYNAKISTIDGFCTEFVRQYFYKLNIQYDFRIADEGELKILSAKAIDNALEFFYSQNNENFCNLVNALCTYRNDDKLKDNVLKVYKFFTSVPFMENRIKKMIKLYDTKLISFEQTPYFSYIMQYASECLEYCKNINTLASERMETDEYINDKQREKFRVVFSDDKAILKGLTVLTEQKDWNGLMTKLSSIKFKNFPIVKDNGEDNDKAVAKNLRESYKSQLKKLSELFFTDIDAIKQNTDKLYPLVKSFFDCVLKFKEEFTRLKNEKNILDFSDIENLMIDLLCKEEGNSIEYTDISKEISDMFDCIMVDEFQDVNEVQNFIFKALSREKNNLFIVGDVKQSIYGFRQAKPDIFIKYKESYDIYSRVKDVYPAKIILDRNFRSRKGITEACNFVFKNLMSPSVGGLSYNDEEKLVCGATYPKNDNINIEVLIADSSNIDAEHNESELTLEVEQVAKKIHKLIFEEKLQVKDKDTVRNVTYGDIAILLRSPKGDTRHAVTFVNILNQYLIPTVSQEKNSFFDANEIKIMLNILRVIDNPLQDIPVLSVLMSPMFSFTADDLAQIRAKYRKMPLYNAIKKSAEENNKAAQFIEFISKMRTLSVTSTVDRLIGIIIQSTGFESIVMALNNGPAKNLYLLQEYARSYASNGYKTLTAFINYIDRIKARGINLNAGEESGKDGLNAVQVMSIHASKGLEFPVCFICCTSTKFNVKDTSNDVVLNADNGIGFRYKNEFLKYDTIQRKALSLMEKNTFISEEMRVLYVAMTRAKERLIVTCTQKDPLAYVSSLESKITDNSILPYAVKNCSCFSDWIVCCALLHPSLQKLRDKIGSNLNICTNSDLLPWKFEVLNSKVKKDEKISITDTISENNNSDLEIKIENPEFLQVFKNRVNFKYKNKPLQTLPQKVSASELAHKDNKIFSKILKKPEFLSDIKASGTDIGTAFHNFMQYCDLKSAREDASLESKRLADNGYLSEKQIKILNYEKLKAFLHSNLITRVLNSEDYFREFKFTVKISSSDFDSDIQEEFCDRKIVMQGAVDLAFIEDNKLVIVDYKTDRIKEISDLGDMYSKQVLLYKNAMEQSTNLKVKEVIIYSISHNQSLSLKI